MADTIFQQFNRVESQRRGIDPAVSEAAWNTEGGLTEPARLGDFSGPPWYSGKSWYAAQLHWGGAGYESFGHTAGMGNSFSEFTGWRPGDPRAWRDALRYALDAVKRGGWGPWYGPATIGITGMRGIDVNFHWGGTPDNEWDFKTGAMAPMPELPFNPDAPIDQQPNGWSCALQSTQWLLRSIGRNPDASNPITDPWLTSELVPSIITPESGLLNATGQPLADWITRTYGAEMGFLAQATPVTFEDVLAGAGVNPMIVGGRKWGAAGHWAGVRRAEGGVLVMANPALGYDGIQDRMTARQWTDRGPWSCVWIDRLSTLSPAQNPEPQPVEEPWRAQVRQKLLEALAILDGAA